MAEKKELIENWLRTLPAGTMIGVDDGGLTLKAIDIDAYYEIGGLPQFECPWCGNDMATASYCERCGF